jgi:hypothetical protein
MHKLLKADHELERECHELALQYRRAPKAQQDALKKKLEESVNKHFEARQERRLLEVKRLEEEVQRLRESIAKRNEGKPQAVSRRIAELLGQAEEPPF